MLGDPVAHSLSPVLHRAAYAVLGLDWSYDAHRVPAGGLAEFVSRHYEEYVGLSLTMPLKREALDLAEQASASADLARSANTLRLTPQGPVADNTDLPGAVAALAERGVERVARAVVLGAGATAGSIGLALVQLGAREVRILARDASRAADTLTLLREHPYRPMVKLAGLLGSEPLAADVVVSTIPAEAQTAALVQRCAGVPVIFEARYDPWPTPLAASAGDRVLVSGLDLLVHQAVRQVLLFTGAESGGDEILPAMRAAGERALRARSVER